MVSPSRSSGRKEMPKSKGSGGSSAHRMPKAGPKGAAAVTTSKPGDVSTERNRNGTELDYSGGTPGVKSKVTLGQRGGESDEDDNEWSSDSGTMPPHDGEGVTTQNKAGKAAEKKTAGNLKKKRKKAARTAAAALEVKASSDEEDESEGNNESSLKPDNNTASTQYLSSRSELTLWAMTFTKNVYFPHADFFTFDLAI